MFVSIVIDDGRGSGHDLGDWLRQHGCPCTLVGDYQSAFSAITDLQIAGASLILMFAPVAQPSLEFVTAVHDAHPAVINGLYTRSPERDHDAALIDQHGLVAVLHHPFSAESPATIGLGHLPPVSAPSRSPSMRTPHPLAHAQAFEPAAGTPPAPVAAPRSNLVGVADVMAADNRSSLWIALLEDQLGCCGELVPRLEVRGVTVRLMTSWREAADLAVHALTPGLIIGPLGDDAKRTGRSLARCASQLVLYSDLPSQVRDLSLKQTYGCLAVIKKPFAIDEIKSIIEWMRTPGWQPPLRDAASPADRGAMPEQSPTARRAPPAVTSRIAALRTPLPGANQLPLQPPPSGAPPLTGIAAIRARKQTEAGSPGNAPNDARATGGLVKRQHVVACASCGADVLAPVDRQTALCARCSGQPL